MFAEGRAPIPLRRATAVRPTVTKGLQVARQALRQPSMGIEGELLLQAATVVTTVVATAAQSLEVQSLKVQIPHQSC